MVVIKGNENLTISPYNYTTLYYKLFSPRRYENLRIFELGLGTNNINIPSNMGPNGKSGASLRGWADFFQILQFLELILIEIYFLIQKE